MDDDEKIYISSAGESDVEDITDERALSSAQRSKRSIDFDQSQSQDTQDTRSTPRPACDPGDLPVTSDIAVLVTLATRTNELLEVLISRTTTAKSKSLAEDEDHSAEDESDDPSGVPHVFDYVYCTTVEQFNHLDHQLRTKARARGQFRRLVRTRYLAGSESSAIRRVMATILSIELAMFFTGSGAKGAKGATVKQAWTPTIVAREVHNTLAPHFERGYSEVSITVILVNYGILW